MSTSPYMDCGWICRVGILAYLTLCLPLLVTAQFTSVPESSLPRGNAVLSLNPSVLDSSLQLPHQFLAMNSDTVLVEHNKRLTRGTDYRIDYRYGTLRFDSLFVNRFLSGTPPDEVKVIVRYQYFPFTFKDSYFRRKLITRSDTPNRDTLKISEPTPSFGLDDIFGRDLQKSGSIVRGFTVGSNRDLSLNSGLRLELAGKIATDIEVVAALTDENTPIQPEGTTQTLQEFDKVFVEIRGTDVTATLGDFNLEFKETEFARLTRKLQGARGMAQYRLGSSSGSISVSGAVPRGKFHTNQFQGLEGVQGPYRLSGRNNERSIIVIAGTERVYIDGELQTRGETNHYTIDYSTGEVTFTSRRLINSASRITIDFEYTDRQYSRSIVAAQSSSNLFDDKARLTVSYLREADDPNAPIDLTITDSARVVLEGAGSDRFKAVLSGVTRVDSNGLYLIDSALVNDSLVFFFRYAPGDPKATYNVTFSNVGFGRGEYTRERIGVFTWKGPGLGDYLPVRLLPLPQSAQIVDLSLDIAPSKDLTISGEFGRSFFDANRFSVLDDVDNAGNAIRIEAAYAPKNIEIGGSDIGSLELRLKERFVDRRFVPLDRTNDIEFNRKWGIDSTTQSDEEIQEVSLRYSPFPALSIGGGYGRIDRGDKLKSVRNDGVLLVREEGLPTINYFVESVRSRESAADKSSSWFRNVGSIEHRFDNVVPGFRYEGESRAIRSISSNVLTNGSFSFDEFGTGLKIDQIWKLALAAELEWRRDDTFLGSKVVRESKSFTQAYNIRLAEWNSLTSSLDVTLREKQFSEEFKKKGNSDIKTVLVKNQTRYSPLRRGLDADLFYQVSTEQSSRLERIFVRVTQGSGNYKFLGDLNNNGLADENEFELTRFDGDYIALTLPTEELLPVIDLKSSIRLRITPERFIEQPEGALENIASVISTESYVRIEEKSSERDLKQIYLIRFDRFQQDATTISGSTFFSQDINVFEGRPEFSSRLRYLQRKGMNKFSSAVERSFSRERSIRFRWQLVPEIANQVDYINKIDRLSSSEPSNRTRDILSNSIIFDVSYRPIQNVELGMKFEVGTSTDRLPVPPVDADLNGQLLRFVYAFQGSGQVRAEMAREEIILGRGLDTFPFELTGGRVAGKTWLWRVAFDYRVTQFIQATVNYDGRSEGGRPPLHTARAEVRAFF